MKFTKQNIEFFKLNFGAENDEKVKVYRSVYLPVNVESALLELANRTGLSKNQVIVAVIKIGLKTIKGGKLK